MRGSRSAHRLLCRVTGGFLPALSHTHVKSGQISLIQPLRGLVNNFQGSLEVLLDPKPLCCCRSSKLLPAGAGHVAGRDTGGNTGRLRLPLCPLAPPGAFQEDGRMLAHRYKEQGSPAFPRCSPRGRSEVAQAMWNRGEASEFWMHLSRQGGVCFLALIEVGLFYSLSLRGLWFVSK